MPPRGHLSKRGAAGRAAPRRGAKADTQTDGSSDEQAEERDSDPGQRVRRSASKRKASTAAGPSRKKVSKPASDSSDSDSDDDSDSSSLAISQQLAPKSSPLKKEIETIDWYRPALLARSSAPSLPTLKDRLKAAPPQKHDGGKKRKREPEPDPESSDLTDGGSSDGSDGSASDADSEHTVVYEERSVSPQGSDPSAPRARVRVPVKVKREQDDDEPKRGAGRGPKGGAASAARAREAKAAKAKKGPKGKAVAKNGVSAPAPRRSSRAATAPSKPAKVEPSSEDEDMSLDSPAMSRQSSAGSNGTAAKRRKVVEEAAPPVDDGESSDEVPMNKTATAATLKGKGKAVAAKAIAPKGKGKGKAVDVDPASRDRSLSASVTPAPSAPSAAATAAARKTRASGKTTATGAAPVSGVTTPSLLVPPPPSTSAPAKPPGLARAVLVGLLDSEAAAIRSGEHPIVRKIMELVKSERDEKVRVAEDRFELRAVELDDIRESEERRAWRDWADAKAKLEQQTYDESYAAYAHGKYLSELPETQWRDNPLFSNALVNVPCGTRSDYQAKPIAPLALASGKREYDIAETRAAAAKSKGKAVAKEKEDLYPSIAERYISTRNATPMAWESFALSSVAPQGLEGLTAEELKEDAELLGQEALWKRPLPPSWVAKHTPPAPPPAPVKAQQPQQVPKRKPSDPPPPSNRPAPVHQAPRPPTLPPPAGIKSAMPLPSTTTTSTNPLMPGARGPWGFTTNGKTMLEHIPGYGYRQGPLVGMKPPQAQVAAPSTPATQQPQRPPSASNTPASQAARPLSASNTPASQAARPLSASNTPASQAARPLSASNTPASQAARPPSATGTPANPLQRPQSAASAASNSSTPAQTQASTSTAPSSSSAPPPLAGTSAPSKPGQPQVQQAATAKQPAPLGRLHPHAHQQMQPGMSRLSPNLHQPTPASGAPTQRAQSWLEETKNRERLLGLDRPQQPTPAAAQQPQAAPAQNGAAQNGAGRGQLPAGRGRGIGGWMDTWGKFPV